MPLPQRGPLQVPFKLSAPFVMVSPSVYFLLQLIPSVLSLLFDLVISVRMGLLSLELWSMNRLHKCHSWTCLFCLIIWEPLRAGAVSLVCILSTEDWGWPRLGPLYLLPDTLTLVFLPSFPFTLLMVDNGF